TYSGARHAAPSRGGAPASAHRGRRGLGQKSSSSTGSTSGAETRSSEGQVEGKRKISAVLRSPDGAPRLSVRRGPAPFAGRDLEATCTVRRTSRREDQSAR